MIAAGMVLKDGGLPGAGVDVGIDLGGEDGLVAEHLLDNAEIGAVLNEVGGKGVAESVWRDFLGDAGNEGLLLNQIEH